MEEKKEHENRTHSKKNFTNKIRENPWMLSTLVVSAVCLILLVVSFSGITGQTISSKAAGEYLVDFFASQGISGLEVQGVGTQGGVYVVNLSYDNDFYPFYVTKSGYFIGESLQSIVPVKSTASSTKSVKSDIPSAELFIWSYCPYGVTALGPFAEVAKLLGNSADFKVYLYYAGHGDFEEQQNKIQACIQNLEPENYWDYAESFVETIYPKCSGDIECDLKESTTLMNSLGIDSSAILSCVENEGDSLLQEDYNAAKDAGVQGSPTLIINGVQQSVSRTAESYKGAVCEAFNNVPSECSQTLDSTGSTATGNC